MSPLGSIGVSAPGLPPAGADRRERAAREFEAYMVAFLAQELRSSLPEGPFSSGPAAMFAGLFDQEVGRRVAEAGGLGLRAQLERALAEREVPPVHRPVTPSVAPVTSAFGLREDPFTHTRRLHRGVDLGLPAGSPVRAYDGGTVRFAGERGGYGKVVVIAHDDGSEARYAHCATLAVVSGQRVEAGTALGTVGSTGRATGPHLHLELWRDGAAVDPGAWLSTRTGGERWR